MFDKLKAMFGGKPSAETEAGEKAHEMVDATAEAAHDTVETTEDAVIDAAEEVDEMKEEVTEKFCETCNTKVPADHSHEA